MSPKPIQRRRKRRKTKHKKKKVSQLFKITTKIAGLLPSLEIEKIQHEEYTPWTKSLDLLVKMYISELDK